ncbi:hypothetical protein B0T24DRAFT_523598 [Lasiosphaeria ovina]|uniref:Nephrocystin 3-like N-terminal domain-containing protein n=1 Tax=Lasiosphaeria ovina TaxID=92902 RepID=A0AAE0KIX1_9PEZI|nr:hypothetical protein B0T24DRAFT_523598 [Lasiosphaeria ovina]
MLWIHGIPGAGKTVLASFAIEHMKLYCEGTTNQKYAYYYCHYSNGQDESLPLISWVVSQVCRQLSWAPSQLKQLHDRGCEPTLSELQYVLELALVRLESLFIVIDAVDESTPRDELVRFIASMALDSRFRKVRILVTSRKYWDIERFFSGISTSISMKNRYVDADIERHIRSRLNSSFRLQRWRDSFQEIEDALVGKANGMFRWVDCQLHSIERLGDKTKLVSVLQDLPPDLSETYVRIFDAIPDADRQFVSRVLLWVYGDSRAPWSVRRAINAKLLLEAVTFDLYGSVPAGGNGVFDWDYLQDLCGCLITVKNRDPLTDAAACSITLAHYTVWEFLTSSHILSTRVSQFAVSTQAVYRDFATSVLRQALSADPEGEGTDWRRDRDAYCLVLGCALKSDRYLQTPEDLELYFRFLDPCNPHYRRFRAIQSRALHSPSDRAYRFSILKIPAEFRAPEGAGERNYMAEVLLNARLLNDWMPGEHAAYTTHLPPVGRLPQHEIEELGNQRAAGIFLGLDAKARDQEIGFDGKVWDIEAPRRGSRIIQHN